jgi:hypothetical protein
MGKEEWHNGKCKYSLDSLGETQWYSMTKISLGVNAYEFFSFQSKENAGTDEYYPSIKVQLSKQSASVVLLTTWIFCRP